MNWTGFYYDGRTAERQPVTVSVAGGGLHVQRTDGTSFVWPVSELRQTQGSFSSEQLRIERGTDPVEVVFITQPGLPAAIRNAFPDANTSVRGARNTALIVAWSLAALASAAALYVWGAPIFAGWLAPRVPPSWEVALGRDVVDRMAPASRQCGDSAGLADLRSVLDRLVAAGPTTPYTYRLFVVRDSSVNAFAAPGGFVVVHSGLIDAAKTPEEFAGVLAHEIQHVTQRHSTRAIIREVPLRLAISAVAGGSGAETAASLVGSLGALRYRRGDESEADREGMRLLNAARVDPSGMVSFMKTLEAKNGDAPRFVSYLSSHPHTAGRVAALAAMAHQNDYEAQPLLDQVAWDRVRRMCQGEVKSTLDARRTSPSRPRPPR